MLNLCKKKLYPPFQTPKQFETKMPCVQCTDHFTEDRIRPEAWAWEIGPSPQQGLGCRGRQGKRSPLCSGPKERHTLPRRWGGGVKAHVMKGRPLHKTPRRQQHRRGEGKSTGFTKRDIAQKRRSAAERGIPRCGGRRLPVPGLASLRRQTTIVKAHSGRILHGPGPEWPDAWRQTVRKSMERGLE